MDEPESDQPASDHPPQPPEMKHGPGRPRQTSKLDNISFAEVEGIFASDKKKPTATLSDHMAKALAPIHSLSKDHIKVMNDQLTEFSARLDQLSSELKSTLDELHQQAVTAVATVIAKPTYAESVLNSDASQEPRASLPVLSQLSGNPSVPTVRTDRSLNLVVYGIPECKKGTFEYLRFSNDLNSVMNTTTLLDPIIGDYSIKDWHRLEKYSMHTSHVQPILVKFSRASDFPRILYKKLNVSSYHH